jgi:gluconolactonase
MRVLATGLQFPEGPVAMPDGSIILVEIARGTLSRVTPAGAVEVVATLGGGPNSAAFGPGGKIYVPNNGGFRFHRESGTFRPVAQADDYSGGRIEVVDLATGKFERLYDRVNGRGLSGPNDLVFDDAGGFWFSDLGKVRGRDRDHGGVYWARADGSEIREVIYPVLSANGIGLSPDGRTLYVAETESARLWAWDIVAPGEVKKLPWPSPHGGRLVGSDASTYQRFDSLKVAQSGRICVATLIHGGITEFVPEGGLIAHHPLPDPMVTNLCFGGPDRRTAFVTLSHEGRLVAIDWHEPGLKLHYAP